MEDFLGDEPQFLYNAYLFHDGGSYHIEPSPLICPVEVSGLVFIC